MTEQELKNRKRALKAWRTIRKNKTEKTRLNRLRALKAWRTIRRKKGL